MQTKQNIKTQNELGNKIQLYINKIISLHMYIHTIKITNYL